MCISVFIGAAPPFFSYLPLHYFVCHVKISGRFPRLQSLEKTKRKMSAKLLLLAVLVAVVAVKVSVAQTG